MAADSVPERGPEWGCPDGNTAGPWTHDAGIDGDVETLAEKFRARVAMSKAAAENPTNRVALDPTLTPERLADLASHADLWVRAGVARNPRSSPETLRLLARDEDPLVRLFVGSRLSGERCDPCLLVLGDPDLNLDWADIDQLYGHQPSADHALRAERGLADIVLTLASDPEPVVRGTVWGHPDLPARFLRVAAGDPDPQHRAQAAGSRFLPFDLFRRLAIDPWWQVRRALGANESSPTLVLEQLATDSDSEVRRAVASNGATPKETLRDLARDPWLGVRTSAFTTLRRGLFTPQGTA